jgi:hypothetical protein
MVTTILTGILLAVPLQTGEAGESTRPLEFYQAQQNAVSELDGKILVVRLHEDADNAPDEFRPLRIRFAGNQVTIEPDEAAVSSVVVVTPEDQEDEAVKAAFGDRIYAATVTRKLDLRLPFPPAPGREKQQWQFTDALGEPLAGAVVEISLAEYRGPRIPVGRAALDDAGRLAWRRPFGNLPMVSFTVSHPDYGCAEAGQYLGLDDKVIVPLVRKGTVAAERAIYGRVVDPNGAPVPGATIQCSNVRTLGEGLINSLCEHSLGVADANGAFSFYLPNRKSRDDRGELIPPKSQYYVRIEAPKKLGLLPYAEPIENGREALVVLERGDHVRRLRFEDPNGEITDPAKLETITVSLRRPDRYVLMLHYEDWKDGVPLPLGTYEASMRGMPGELRFEPVEITRDSPQKVVFKLPAGVTYYGRVVHGITGRPLPGAFVLAESANCADLRLCDLTAEQWDALHDLASAPPQDDAGLEPLRKIYSFVKLVRTDATGSYGLVLEPDEGFYGFVAFEQDYLAVMHRRHSLIPGPDHFAEVPTLKLFPAATVLVETVIDKEHPSIMPRWEIDEGSRPAWVAELLGLDDGRESFLEYKDWLKPNARQPVHVPAGVSLRLKLETPYDEEFCPLLIPQEIYLRQGETADLGRFAFEPALVVQVRVIDAAGQAQEGIPVRRLLVDRDGTRGWSVPHNTDGQGLARFYVVPNSAGSFGVSCGNRDSGPLNATVDYQVGGPEDAGREFVLPLSEEMLALLLQ